MFYEQHNRYDERYRLFAVRSRIPNAAPGRLSTSINLNSRQAIHTCMGSPIVQRESAGRYQVKPVTLAARKKNAPRSNERSTALYVQLDNTDTMPSGRQIAWKSILMLGNKNNTGPPNAHSLDAAEGRVQGASRQHGHNVIWNQK